MPSLEDRIAERVRLRQAKRSDFSDVSAGSSSSAAKPPSIADRLKAQFGEIKEIGKGGALGLAKSGYGTAKGVAWLADKATGGSVDLGVMDALERGEAEAQDFYNPQGTAGKVGEFTGRLVGEGALALAGGGAAGRALTKLAPASKLATAIAAGKEGSLVQKIAANTLPFAPVDFAIGAGAGEPGDRLSSGLTNVAFGVGGGAALESVAHAIGPATAKLAARSAKGKAATTANLLEDFSLDPTLGPDLPPPVTMARNRIAAERAARAAADPNPQGALDLRGRARAGNEPLPPPPPRAGQIPLELDRTPGAPAPAPYGRPAVLHDGDDFVNPIDPKAPPAEKVRQLEALSQENAPVIDGLRKRLDELFPGSRTSEPNFKDPRTIAAKASRPEVLRDKPWHGVEHIRDGLRFKTELNSLEDLPAMVAEARKAGLTPIKIDTDKFIRPKDAGWRFVAVDFRAPNGQMVEWYASPKELIEVNQRTHKGYEHWREKDLKGLAPDEELIFKRLMRRTSDRYDTALQQYFKRSGSTPEAWGQRWGTLADEIRQAGGPEEAPRFSAPTSESAADLSAGSRTSTQSTPTALASPEISDAPAPVSQALAPAGLTNQPPSNTPSSPLGPRITSGSESGIDTPEVGRSYTPNVTDSKVRGPVGSTDKLWIRNHELPFRYRVVEADELVPSNDPRKGFNRRPDYPEKIQGRVYHGDAGKGARERVVEMAAGMAPEKMTHPSRSVSGPPVVTSDGVAIVGNQRVMAQAIAHDAGPKGQAIRESILRDAKMLGVDPGEVARMKAPVVVRELLDVDPANHDFLATLNQLSDIGGAKQKNPLVQAAGRARQLARHPEIVDDFASAIAPDQTINDFLSSAKGPDFLARLVKAEVIAPAELDQFRDAASGKLTKFGRERLSEIFPLLELGGNPSIIDNAPASIMAKLEQSWPAAVKATGTDEAWSLRTQIQEALELHTQKVDNGLGSIDDLVGQADLFGREAAAESPGVKLARFIESKKKAEVTAAFRQYAEAAEASRVAGQSDDMFGGQAETALEAFDRIFSGRGKGRAGRIGSNNESAGFMLGGISGSGAGGLTGAAAGALTGDTPEDRRRRAAAGFLVGAGAGGAAGAALGRAAFRNIEPALEAGARGVEKVRSAIAGPPKREPVQIFRDDYDDNLFPMKKDTWTFEKSKEKVAEAYAAEKLLPAAEKTPAKSFRVLASNERIQVRMEGRPTAAQLEEVVTKVRENPDAKVRWVIRDTKGRPVSSGTGISDLFAEARFADSAEPLRGSRMRGAIGDQPGKIEELEKFSDDLYRRPQGEDASGRSPDHPDYDTSHDELGTCTTGACAVSKKYNGKVFGYSSNDNPTALLGADEGGHDFALIDDRYLVDPWAKHVAGEMDQNVLDLHDPIQAGGAEEWYGPRDKWELVRDDTRSKGAFKNRAGAIGDQPANPYRDPDARGAYLGETDLLNVSKIVESSTAQERIAEAAEKYRGMKESQRQTWAEADPKIKAAVDELLAGDHKARAPHIARKLTGVQILARRDVIRQNDELIETLSRQIEGKTLPIGEHEKAVELLQKAVEHNDALLKDIITGASQKGRDLNLLKRIANKSLDHDVWQIQAKRMLGDRPLTDELAAQLRKLVTEAQEACK